jgi:hypothetical protein
MIEHVLLKLIPALLHTLSIANPWLIWAFRVGTLNLQDLRDGLLVFLRCLSTSWAMPN